MRQDKPILLIIIGALTISLTLFARDRFKKKYLEGSQPSVDHALVMMRRWKFRVGIIGGIVFIVVGLVMLYLSIS